ncbi:MAG: O-antigen ligase family protein [Prevotella sp.]|nr:O-antigen ligase family protein [Candidatus Equicola stercoris]
MNRKRYYILFATIAVYIIAMIRVVFRDYFTMMEYSPVSAYSMILLVAYSLFLIISTPTSRKGPILNKMIFLMLVLGIIDALKYGFPQMLMLKVVLSVSLWEVIYFTFYRIQATDGTFIISARKFFMLLFVPIVLLFIRSQLLRYSMLLSFVGKEGNNMIFYVITMIPWILLINKRKYKTILLIIVTILCVISLKRSALIGVLLVDSFYLYIEFIKHSSNKARAIVLFVILIGAFSFSTNLANNFSDNMAISRMNSIKEDEGSGRIDHWKDTWNLVQSESSLEKNLLGHGYCGVEVALNEPNHSAHNDFLEVLYDYGWIALILYVFIHLLIIKRLKSLVGYNKRYLLPYISSYIVFIVLSMVSHLVIYPTYFIFLTSFWGAIEGACVKASRS